MIESRRLTRAGAWPGAGILISAGFLAVLALASSGPADDPRRDPLGLGGGAGGARVLALAGSKAMGVAWREARLQERQSAHEENISAYALRYGITRKLSSQIYEAARAEEVHPALAFSLVRVESGFDARALGRYGAIGLTQLKPSTARELAPHVTASDLYLPRLNLRLGFRYLRLQIERFDDVALALAAYNRGPSHVADQLARGETPRSPFARKILRNIDRGAAAEL